MDKHTQKIRWQQPRNCLSVFDHFVGLALKGLSNVTRCSDDFKENRGKLVRLNTPNIRSEIFVYDVIIFFIKQQAVGEQVVSN